MRRAFWACLSLTALIGGLGSSALAVERELAGVRLGEQAFDLLDKPGYGEPHFIGPLGSISIAAPEQQVAAAPALGPSLTGRAGGRRGAGSARSEMRAGRAARGARGAGAARGARAGSAARAPATGRTGAGRRGAAPEAGMYWYYRRPGGAVVVLSLDRLGEVKSITLTGNSPYPEGRTTRGIGLTTDYMEIIAQYGYPDQVLSAGTSLELTYVDHGVRFTLDGMRVREIAIGAQIAAAAEVAPAAPEAVPPPAGMSTEELRGYL